MDVKWDYDKYDGYFRINKIDSLIDSIIDYMINSIIDNIIVNFIKISL